MPHAPIRSVLLKHTRIYKFTTNMAAEHQYFYEDEIFRLNKKGNFELGMVLENSERLSSDEEDDEYEGTVKNGFIRVAWHPSGVEEVLQEKKVNLADRSLMPGDVVRRLIKGKDTQRGYCRNIHVTSDLQVVGSKQIICQIDSKALSPVEQFTTGVVVVFRWWVGTVTAISSRLHLTLPDGSRCIVTDAEADDFENLEERRGESEFPHRNDFHPGQIMVGMAQDLQGAQWLTPPKELKCKPTKTIRMTVDEVEVFSVTVRWQCCMYSESGEQPSHLVTGDDIKQLRPLNVFESCTLQIGDRAFFVLGENETYLTKEAWRARLEDVHYSRRPQPKRKLADSLKMKGSDDKNKYVELYAEPKSNEGWETDDGDSASVSSGCSSNSSARCNGAPLRRKKTPGLMTKMLKCKKLRRTRRKIPNTALKPHEKVVVETLMTQSTADVVWQDGSVEYGISSCELYPIHHLDDQEFFPGDFVVENKEEGCLRVYGVIQSVDHVGRIAKVTWFHTYTANFEAEPKKLETVEVSVYDLKDHPDFQFRPGTVALRIANFDGENDQSAVGQVLDNYPEGRVHMWWVDGQTSMCWPQDLYKVGDYDSDEGELWEDNASDGSWETESEEELVDDNRKPRLAVNIEKARVSMSRLEEMFTHNPSLQTSAIMQKLLDVYRDCRYLDKLMGTQYFHEMNFHGLLERVREKNRPSLVGQRISDQMSRLSAPCSGTTSCSEANIPHSELNLERVNTTLEQLTVCLEKNLLNDENDCDRSPISVNGGEKSPISLNGGPLVQSTSQDDSGVFEHSAVSADASSSENCDCLDSASSLETRKGTYIFGAMGTRVSYGGSDKRLPRVNNKHVATVPPGHAPSEALDDSNPCAKLCNLIKAQLCLAFTDVYKRFHGDSTTIPLSDVVRSMNESTLDDGTSSTPIEDPAPSLTVEGEGFEIKASAQSEHKFRLGMSAPPDGIFIKTVQRELALLRNALPAGIWVKGYEDRMDLYSVMIRGPEKTPYEDGLFLFDVQLPREYPRAPPIFHYHSYCSDRLNPNLYEDGKVCVSLLGTWKGKGTEVWTANSTLLQVIVSIQGLILVKEPYYNEAGYEKQKGSQQGHENSRMYNEMAVLKLVQAMTKLSLFPHPDFKTEVQNHFAQQGNKIIGRVEKWLEISEKYNDNVPQSPQVNCTEIDAQLRNQQWRESEINMSSMADQPDFPLLPASRGFCITMRKTLEGFRNAASS